MKEGGNQDTAQTQCIMISHSEHLTPALAQPHITHVLRVSLRQLLKRQHCQCITQLLLGSQTSSSSRELPGGHNKQSATILKLEMVQMPCADFMRSRRRRAESYLTWDSTIFSNSQTFPTTNLRSWHISEWKFWSALHSQANESLSH